MKISKLILFILLLTACGSFNIRAQNGRALQKNLSTKSESLPFQDGKSVITDVKFRGLDSEYEKYKIGSEEPVYEDDVRTAVRGNRLIISEGEKFNARKIEILLLFLKKWLADRGYLKAEITALGEALPKNQMIVVFDIKRGVRVGVSDIRFTGNINISNEEYVEDLKQCLGDGWKIFNWDRYRYITQKCTRSLMYSKGYFRAVIERIAPQLKGDGYVVTVEVKEGVRFRFGEIKIEGARVFTRKQILEMLGLGEGDIANGRELQDLIYEKLKRVYADRGYPLYNAEFDPKFIEPQAIGLDGTVDLLITIDEGKQFKIKGIVFIEPDGKENEELKEDFTLKSGDLYNLTEFEKGIKVINETGKFSPIDIDRDINIRTDEENGEVFYIVRLRQNN